MKKNFKYYVKFANSCKFKVDKNDKQSKKFKQFKKKYGFRPEETWNLDRSILIYIMPRLAYFKDHHHGVPTLFFKDEDKLNPSTLETMEADQLYCDAIQTILDGFEIYLSTFNAPTEDERKEIENAFELFSKLFTDLWD